MRGIIPRSIDKILDECDRLRAEGWTYTTKVSFMEIYNETIRDLLDSSKNGSKKFSIRKDTHGSFSVPELTLEAVTASHQVESLIERASRARSVAKTDMNTQSSRSHCILRCICMVFKAPEKSLWMVDSIWLIWLEASVYRAPMHRVPG